MIVRIMSIVSKERSKVSLIEDKSACFDEKNKQILGCDMQILLLFSNLL